MLLITEVFNEDCEVLKESAPDGKKNYYIEGIFMQSDLRNRNGRVYPGPILEKEMKRYNENFIKTKRALGELGHPDGPQINGDRVSHLITEMRRDGNNFMGKAKIIGTPMGEIVKTFIDEGVKIGVSTRGLGSVKQTNEGIMEVQNDFHLATVDIVTDPSGPNCFVNGIMENTEYYFDIASSSWRTTPALQIVESELKQDMKEQAAVDIAKFEGAMKRLDRLDEEIKKLKKKPVIKTEKRIDEETAIHLFQEFVESLKK